MARDLEIGGLEADVLRALKRLGSASAGEVLEELQPSRFLAYTTVSTTLDRLHRKGLVARRQVSGRTGQKYSYSFPHNPDIERRVVDRTVDRLVRAFGPSVAAAIYDRLREVAPEQAADHGRAAEGKTERDTPRSGKN